MKLEVPDRTVRQEKKIKGRHIARLRETMLAHQMHNLGFLPQHCRDWGEREGGSKEKEKRNGRHIGRKGKSKCMWYMAWSCRQKRLRNSRNLMRSERRLKVTGYRINSKNGVDSCAPLTNIGNEMRKAIAPLIKLHENSKPMCCNR